MLLNERRLRVLFIVDQCNPDWASVPLIGYRLFDELSKRTDLTLVTHSRNRNALERVREGRNVVYIEESPLLSRWYRFVETCCAKGAVNWPLLNALSYPIYSDFNRKVYRQFYSAVSRGDYDLVHAFTPVLPRYPVKLVKACGKVPFVLGPVNGGLPYPQGFAAVEQKEGAKYRILKQLSFVLPNFKRTYRDAAQVLVGSNHTLNMLRNDLALSADKTTLFFENGIGGDFLIDEAALKARLQRGLPIRILFVGRLVPYKGADMLIEAYSCLPEAIRKQAIVTIVGDGEERKDLEQLAVRRGVKSHIAFVGWVPQQETRRYYHESDIFCFPSIREFGGGVVLEAMAAGLPSIVVDYGGIAEYVTSDSGIKLPLGSREGIVKQLTSSLERLVQDNALRSRMSYQARGRARAFEWGRKADTILELYQSLI